jgi:hypothetical protein
VATGIKVPLGSADVLTPPNRKGAGVAVSEEAWGDGCNQEE